ncbi:hypothetical protein [Streptomyces sp. NPDC093589]|uniref:hypothetical protein n=1 Tax=Streptomyces sp. NPDC093589 TaxID=3366043 RepID=UPI0037F3988A
MSASGDSATVHVAVSVPTAAQVATPPEASAARRSWGTAAVVATALLVTAVVCGVMALSVPRLALVCQVAGTVTGAAGAVAAVVTAIGSARR